MTTYVFDQVATTGRKSGICAVCGKRASRSRTFTNTINPYNRNPDGTVRTRAEVWANVQRLRAEWEAEPVMHQGCDQ